MTTPSIPTQRRSSWTFLTVFVCGLLLVASGARAAEPTVEPSAAAEPDSGTPDQVDATAPTEEPAAAPEPATADTTTAPAAPPHVHSAPPQPPAAPTLSTPTVTPTPAPAAVTPRAHITGHIWRMSPGLIFLRTQIGLVTLSCKTCLRDLKGNPTITIDVHGTQGVVTVTPHGAGAREQRYWFGTLPTDRALQAPLTLWTPDGDQTFTIDKIAPKLAAAPPNRPVTLELGPNQTVAGLHDLQLDLQVSQLPAQPGSLELHAVGTVSKIKNGYIHVQTPLGVLPITGKTGLCAAKDRCLVKVGDGLTLWIHETTAVMDLTPGGSGAPTRRLLSGKVSYDRSDKQSLSMWTPSGIQSFSTAQAAGSLGMAKDGTPIVIELDGSGTLREIRKLN